MRALATLLLLLEAANPAADGLKALEEKKYDVAVTAFTQAIAADPKDYFSHFQLGLTYTYLRRDGEAIAEYRKTLELKPGLPEAQLNAGILLLKLKQADEAAPLLEQVVAQKPNQFRPRYLLAQAILAQGDDAKAEEQFRAALALDAKSPGAELGLGQSLARQNRLTDAAPHYRRAAELDPAYRNSLLELASLFEKAKLTDDAIEVYRQFPDNAAAQERLGELLLDTKQYADAIPRLEQGFAKEPTQANRTALAAAYQLSRQLDKALPLLERSVAAEPANAELRLMYARGLRDRKQFALSAMQFYEAAKLHPGARETWNDLGCMLYMTGDLEKSLMAFDRSHQLGDDTPGNWFFRAIIQDKMRLYKPAMAAYQRYLELDKNPDSDEAFKARQRIKVIVKELSKH